VHTPPETKYTALASRSSPVQLLKWRDRWHHYLRNVANVCISFVITLVLCVTLMPLSQRVGALDCWHHLRDRQAVGMCTVLSRTNWITAKCMHAVCQRTWMITKLVIWDSNAFDTFCPSKRAVTAVQACRAWNVTPETKKASMMWKNPSHLWEFQTNAVSKEDHDNCLFGTIKVCIF